MRRGSSNKGTVEYHRKSSTPASFDLTLGFGVGGMWGRSGREGDWNKKKSGRVCVRERGDVCVDVHSLKAAYALSCRSDSDLLHLESLSIHPLYTHGSLYSQIVLNR